MRSRVGVLFVCAVAFASAGCSSGGSNTAELRVFQAAAGAPRANIVVDGNTVAQNIGYGNGTDYLSVNSGSRHLQLVPVSGGSPIFDQTVSLTANGHQTVLLTGTSSSVKVVTLNDGNTTTTTTGEGFVRVINASNAMGVTDIYIVPAGDALTTPTAANVGFDGNTDYQMTPVGNYEVFFTAPGTTPPQVNLSTGPLNLTANSNQTIVAYDAAGGGYTYVLLTDQ